MDTRFSLRSIVQALVLGAGILVLVSCKTVHPKAPVSRTESEQIIDESIKIDKAREKRNNHRSGSEYIPYSVNNALLPSISSYVKPAQVNQDRFDVTANNVPAKEFFMGLVNGTNLNMLVHPNISGKISIDLKNVTLRQTLEAIKDMYGYDFQRTSYGYEVFQPQLTTRLFHINYLDVQRTGESYTQLTTGQVSSVVGPNAGQPGTTGQTTSNSNPYNNNINNSNTPSGTGTISTIETRTEMKFWKDVEKSIQSMVPKDADHIVTVNAQSGVISIRAYPAELKNIERYVNSLQTSLNRQVILEAKILEVVLDDTYQAGIDWSVLGNPALINPATGTIDNTAGMGQATNHRPNDDSEFNLPNFTGFFALKINGNFKALIKLLQGQGNVQVLSSPHIATVNNQKAVIKVGSDEFFVTAVSTTNSVVGNNTLPSQSVTLTPFFSGITLDVTPEISSESTVVLHIHPSVSLVTQQDKTIQLGQTAPNTNNTLNLPLARSTIRESDNIVRAKNGQIVVIGGLMTNNTSEIIVETPGLGRIPWVGSFFRRTSQVSKKTELVILLRPIVATNNNIVAKLEDEKREFKILKRDMHFGGLPHVFGNEAERSPD